MQLLRGHPLLCFFALAFLFTWSNWVPRALASHGLININLPAFMFLVAGYGPAAAAIIVTSLIYGRPGLHSLGRRLCRWRVGYFWYFIALFLPALQSLTAFGLHLLFGGEVQPSTPGFQVGSPGSPVWIQALIMIPIFTLGFDGIGEELGWRGFALPHLLAKYPALAASLLMACVWALWHLPFALTIGTAMSGNPLGYLTHMFAASILFTWIFNNTRGSVLIAILFHASANIAFNILPLVIPGIHNAGIWNEIVRWLIVALVIAYAGARNLSRQTTLSEDAPYL